MKFIVLRLLLRQWPPPRQTKGNSDQVPSTHRVRLRRNMKLRKRKNPHEPRTSKEGRFTPAVTLLICWDHSGGKPPFLTCPLLEKYYCNLDLLFRVSLKRR